MRCYFENRRQGGLPRLLDLKGSLQDWLHTSTAHPGMSPGHENHKKIYYITDFETDQEKYLLKKPASGTKPAKQAQLLPAVKRWFFVPNYEKPSRIGPDRRQYIGEGPTDNVRFTENPVPNAPKGAPPVPSGGIEIPKNKITKICRKRKRPDKSALISTQDYNYPPDTHPRRRALNPEGQKTVA